MLRDKSGKRGSRSIKYLYKTLLLKLIYRLYVILIKIPEPCFGG